MEKYREPTDEQLKEVLRRIPTLQLRRAFFEGLKNPLWVKALAKQGAFANPPEPKVLDDGSVRDIYWPEIDYLVRVSNEVPVDVVDVLVKLTKSNNAWVKRAVFEVGSSIPADQAVRLRPLINFWVSTGFGWRTDPRHLVGFATNLLSGGQREAGIWFANLLFKPMKTKRLDKTGTALEEYWYAHELPRLVEKLGGGGLAVVLPWLVVFERSNGHFSKKSDISYFARDSIRVSDREYEDVEQALIDAVRDLAITAMKQDPQKSRSLLLDTKMILARKIALFSLSEAIEQDVDESGMAPLLDVAYELLLDEPSLSEGCRIDHADLARAFAKRRPDSLEKLATALDLACARLDDERLREWLARETDDPAAINKSVLQYQDAWMHRWLAAIGSDALPAELRDRLAELDARLGVIESPREPSSTITSWTGPNSPITQDEMSLMSPNELVAHLESWHDTGNGFGPEPSHEGQGRSVAALLTTSPDAIAGVEGLVDRLRPTYLRSIMQGWEAAVKAGLTLNWEQVLLTARQILAHSDESGFPAEGGRFDEDLDFRPAKEAVVGLLEELAKKRDEGSNVLVPVSILNQVAELLLGAANDKTEFSRYVVGAKDSSMDALTLSLNWRWPVWLRGLTHLIAHGSETGWFEAARSAFEDELARDDPYGASRAVLGEGLARLFIADQEWVELRRGDWFGAEEDSSRNQQFALSVAVATHRYHKQLLELLGPAMIGAIRSTEAVAVGWRTETDPLQEIGGWLVEAVIRGEQTLDDPVVTVFFSEAPVDVRGGAMGHVAWRFMRADEVSSGIRDKFATLWDNRLEHVREHPADKEELSGFYWVVKSGKFETGWWLPRLKEVASLDPTLGRQRYMISEELGSSASLDPHAAFDVLRLLLAVQDEDGLTSYGLMRDAVPQILAAAITSGDANLKADAERYMNQLGEQGNLQLESEVWALTS
ncbi:MULTISPECIES: hypothetical protein [unclassified Pseudonocardia]|uniref:hypothetical protein n=1 Tax=unclassified Pseudonocardia TaxID=2619320 RepID=UPI000B0954FC|nr:MULTISPECIES: hypothetical protein [unclassified Pseudonocardia]